jgi:succinate dehydrogenase/fumarate reductase cytochrome b subunit
MRICHSFSGFFLFFFLVGGSSFSILEKIKNEKATVNSTLGVVHPKAFFFLVNFF